MTPSSRDRQRRLARPEGRAGRAGAGASGSASRCWSAALLAEALGQPGCRRRSQRGEPGRSARGDSRVKLSIRMTADEAERLAAGARRSRPVARCATSPVLLPTCPRCRHGCQPHRPPRRAHRLQRRTLDAQPQHPPPDLAAAPRQRAAGAGVPRDARHAGRRRARPPDAGRQRPGRPATAQPAAAAPVERIPPHDRQEIAMSQAPNIDGVLIQWGDRLFYPGNRIVKAKPQPKLNAAAARQRAAADPRAHRGHRRAPRAAGDGQGHRRRARHEGHRRPLPLHQQERPARHRGRARRDDARQGRAARTGRRLALRRHA